MMDEPTLKNNLKSQTALARKQMSGKAHAPGSVRRTASQKFKVKEKNAPVVIEKKSKKEATKQKKKNSRITPDVFSPNITKEELEEKEKIAQAQKEKKAKEEKKIRDNFFFRFLHILIIFAVIMALVLVAVFFIWLPSNNTGNVSDYYLQTGTDKNKLSSVQVSWKIARKNGIYYLNMTNVADYCEMATTGDIKTIRYVIKDTMDDIVFTVDDGNAKINGVTIRLDGKVFMYNDCLYVPMSFVNNYMNGISSEYVSKSHKIRTLRETDKDGNYVPITFNFATELSSKPIDFSSLDGDLQREIIYRQEINDPIEEPEVQIP